MKTLSFASRSALAAIFTSISAFAQISTPTATPTNGALPEYKYQVSSVTLAEAQALMSSERVSTNDKSICANRANMWSYIMNRDHGTQVGKVFVHFTDKTATDEAGSWAYHVAPYVIVNGVEMVLDSAFPIFGNQPVSLSQWLQNFAHTSDCRDLHPAVNADDLKIEQYDMGLDGETPLKFTSSRLRAYPSINGATCYTHKVPMYYVFPFQIYGADLAISGQAEFGEFVLDAFDRQEALMSCKQAKDPISGFFNRNDCKNYMGIK